MTAESITQAFLKSLFRYDPETGEVFRLSGRYTGKTGWVDKEGYHKLRIADLALSVHRVAFLYMTGKWPASQVDHKNGVRSDNRWGNLREATLSENARNHKRLRTNTSGVTGASWKKSLGLWQSAIKANGKSLHLGYFETKEEAGRAYAAAARQHFGEFVRKDTVLALVNGGAK